MTRTPAFAVLLDVIARATWTQIHALVDRIPRLAPTPDGGDDLIGVLGPLEGARGDVCLGEAAFDGSLERNQQGEDPRLSRCLVSLANKLSTAFSQEAEVGLTWKVQRGWRSSQA